jgi:hypothetical protein
LETKHQKTDDFNDSPGSALDAEGSDIENIRPNQSACQLGIAFMLALEEYAPSSLKQALARLHLDGRVDEQAMLWQSQGPSRINFKNRDRKVGYCQQV